MKYPPLDNLKKNYRKKKKVLTRFLRGLPKRKVRGLDSKAIALNKEAFEKIDCLKCGNCCKTMNPTWKKAEIKRVAERVGMTYKEYFDKYLVVEKGDISNKLEPCQHLGKGNKCSIYDIRPNDCRGFPHTQNRDFALYIGGTHIQNLEYCPATFYVVEKLFEQVVEGKNKQQ